MRFNRLYILICLCACLMPAACEKGESPENDEDPECTDHIEDEGYKGSYRALFGFGEGVYAVLQLFADDPESFNVVALLHGPTSAEIVLSEMLEAFTDIDTWPDTPSHPERIAAYRDWIAAYGNPFYVNDASLYYPPGVDAGDFTTGQSVTFAPIYSPANPDLAYPSVTVYDDSGEPLDFVLAHDLNENGVRDAGEPLILHYQEPFTDADADGLYDDGETYEDVGLDGVTGTGDTGEGNAQFDQNPRIAQWLAHDPLNLLASVELDPLGGYPPSVYLDSLREDPWRYTSQMKNLASNLQNMLEGSAGGMDPWCITNELGIYQDFLGDYPVFTNPIWFQEKFVWLDLYGSTADMWTEENEALRAARFNHALRFISLRMPNGLDDISKESSPIWQVRTFYSETMQADVSFGVGFPAGYFDEFSYWKTYPVIYVFHDRWTDLNDWREILVRQGDLAGRDLAKQALIIVLDGTRAAEGLSGYHHYVNQAATEFGGNYGDLVKEIMIYVETAFRVQTEVHDRDDDDD